MKDPAKSIERLVLASSSPRRRELLEMVGFDVEVHPVCIPETPRAGESETALVHRLAREKASQAAVSYPRSFVLGADTIVTLGGQIMGKPGNSSEARQMLQALSGKWHHVLTGIALAHPEGLLRVDHATTAVRFGILNDDDIERYITGREPYDKAGAYAIQGIAGWFVEEIRGSVSNVIGLPLERVRRLLSEGGFPPPRLC